MAPEPQAPRPGVPPPGLCMVGWHEAREVWTFGPPILPRRICAYHLARAISRAGSTAIDRWYRRLSG